MRKSIKNSILITGISTVALLSFMSVNGMKENDNRYRVYAAGDVKIEGQDVDNTIYCTGSVSKVYVTAAVMQLVDQGKVDLDAPVIDYIDDFKMADERYKDITVRMLMNHSSGLMGTVLKDDTLINDNVLDREKLMLTNLATQHLKADPGAYSSYCNDGFDLHRRASKRNGLHNIC